MVTNHDPLSDYSIAIGGQVTCWLHCNNNNKNTFLFVNVCNELPNFKFGNKIMATNKRSPIIKSEDSYFTFLLE